MQNYFFIFLMAYHLLSRVRYFLMIFAKKFFFQSILFALRFLPPELSSYISLNSINLVNSFGIKLKESIILSTFVLLGDVLIRSS